MTENVTVNQTKKTAHVAITNKDEYLNNNYNLNYDAYLLGLKEYALNNNVPIMQDGGIATLITVLRLINAKEVLEIGSAIGFSSSCMVKMTNCNVTTIEIDEDTFNECQKNIKNQDLGNKINSILGDGLLTFDLVNNKTYDLIFIDAAKGQYEKFFELYETLLRPGGVILTDNLYFHDLLFAEIKSRNLRGLVKRVCRYNDYLLNKDGYHTTILEVGDGIGISIKK